MKCFLYSPNSARSNPSYYCKDALSIAVQFVTDGSKDIQIKKICKTLIDKSRIM